MSKIFLRKEKLKFKQEFRDMNMHHDKRFHANKEEVDTCIFNFSSLQKDFDSKWTSIRKVK